MTSVIEETREPIHVITEPKIDIPVIPDKLQTISPSEDKVVIIGGSEYKGPYEAIPKSTQQLFDTNDKLMRGNFVVREIKLHEAPNSFGTTVTIGD